MARKVKVKLAFPNSELRLCGGPGSGRPGPCPGEGSDGDDKSNAGDKSSDRVNEVIGDAIFNAIQNDEFPVSEDDELMHEEALLIATDMLDRDSDLAEVMGAGKDDYDAEEAVEKVAEQVKEVWKPVAEDVKGNSLRIGTRVQFTSKPPGQGGPKKGTSGKVIGKEKSGLIPVRVGKDVIHVEGIDLESQSNYAI